jgi:hypothetical protein
MWEISSTVVKKLYGFWNQHSNSSTQLLLKQMQGKVSLLNFRHFTYYTLNKTYIRTEGTVELCVNATDF